MWIGRRCAPYSGRPTIKAQAATDQVNGRRAEEPINSVGAAIDFRTRTGWQQAEPKLAQQRNAPLIVG